MTTQYRLAIVYSDGSSSFGLFKTKEEALEKSVNWATQLPKNARLELTVIIFSEPVVLFTAV